MAANKVNNEGVSHDSSDSSKYSCDFLDAVWSKMPNFVGTIVATVIIFIVATAMKGDWIIFLVSFLKYWRNDTDVMTDFHNSQEDYYLIAGDWVQDTLKHYRLQNVHKYVIIDEIFSLGIYFGFGGFLHWWFYVRQKDHPETWKCQPNRWLSNELEWEEIRIGTVNVILGALVFGTIACYIDNGGWSTLYFKLDEMGWTYLVISVIIQFFYLDGLTYYFHRAFHYPIIYKYIHKLHHRYKQPTPFSVTALHPVEFFLQQGVMISPMFLAPTHAGLYFLNLMYIYYHGIVTHSGVNWKSIFPWQPEVMFHDNHHQFFHCNYGFNLTIWDHLHGTYRKKDRVYGEDILTGFGKKISEASAEEIKEHEEELRNEMDWNNKFDKE